MAKLIFRGGTEHFGNELLPSRINVRSEVTARMLVLHGERTNSAVVSVTNDFMTAERVVTFNVPEADNVSVTVLKDTVNGRFVGATSIKIFKMGGAHRVWFLDGLNIRLEGELTPYTDAEIAELIERRNILRENPGLANCYKPSRVNRVFIAGGEDTGEVVAKAVVRGLYDKQKKLVTLDGEEVVVNMKATKGRNLQLD